MADPLSIVASVVGLVTAVTKITGLLINLKQDLPDKAITSEIDSLQRGLSSLCMILGRLEGTLKTDFGGESPLPNDLTEDLDRVLKDCMDGCVEWSELLQGIASSDKSAKKVRWVMKRKDIARLSAGLEARKSTLNITLLLIVNLSTSNLLRSNAEVEKATKTIDTRAQGLQEGVTSIHSNTEDIQKGVTTIHSNTEDIKSMIAQLLNNLDNSSLEELSVMVNSRSDASSIIMRRYLENAASYAGSIAEEISENHCEFDASVNSSGYDPSDGASRREPPSTAVTIPRGILESERPTSTRFPREHLDPEVLDEFGLEYDHDGGFLIVKHWMDKAVQDLLRARTSVRRREKSASTESLERRRVTYTRFSRKHLDVEVVEAFGLEYQDDGDYLIVKSDVDEMLMNQLWRRTEERRIALGKIFF